MLELNSSNKFEAQPKDADALAVKVVNSTITGNTPSNILTKLQMAHCLQAVISALKRGLLDLDDIDLP